MSYRNSIDKLSDSGHSNFCVPLALAILAGEDPVETAEHMVFCGYRRKDGGVIRIHTMDYARSMGLDLREVTEEVLAGGGISVSKVCEILDPAKKYLVFTAKHALAVVNGEVQDWTANRRHRVTEVWQVYDGSMGIILVDPIAKLNVQKTKSFIDQVRDLSRHCYVRSSGQEACLKYDDYSCYIRRGRNGYVLQYGMGNPWLQAGVYVRGYTRKWGTRQFNNYQFNTLEEAVYAAEAAHEEARGY